MTGGRWIDRLTSGTLVPLTRATLAAAVTAAVSSDMMMRIRE
jgi:hypothetical protein